MMNYILKFITYPISCILLLACCTSVNDHEKLDTYESIELIYWYDSVSPAINFDSLHVFFGTGFDELSTLKVFLNDDEIAQVQTKTNYSIGYCLSNDLLGIFNIGINMEDIHEGDSLKIVKGQEKGDLIFPLEALKYNRLEISNKDGWVGSFTNSSSELTVQ